MDENNGTGSVRVNVFYMESGKNLAEILVEYFIELNNSLFS